MRRSAVAAARRWAVTERARNIHHVAVELPRTGDEFWALMQSDVHWDNPKCDRDTLLEHLNEAREKDAPIFDNGDFYCAMQGKWDRQSRSKCGAAGTPVSARTRTRGTLTARQTTRSGWLAIWRCWRGATSC